jgi:dUTP pyrophosphatase
MGHTLPLRVQFRRLRPEAKVPTYATDGSVGLDLYAAEAAWVYPGERRVVKTGIAIALEKGYEAQVRPRSGLSSKGHIVTLGTVDQDYTGDVGVLCWNANPGGKWESEDGKSGGSNGPPWRIAVGDRIAQLVITPVARVELVEADELPPTERGERGFGSSGVR